MQGPVTVTAYDWVPELAQGFVRDLRLRWALEEAGFAYEARLIPHSKRESAENLARQPFGQVPVLGVADRSMFESGACVWRIAEASDDLLPSAPAERDACFSWVFAALDTLSPAIDRLAFLRHFADDREAAERIEAQAAGLLRAKLAHLAAALGERPVLVGDRFTVADLLMAFVLRNVEANGDLAPFPALGAYVRRHTSRPAFARALEAQMAPFRENAARYAAAD
ncbi:glutathione S-transferase family protein [Aureimonas flava]|uniref:Glutathione S-transferase family protein n=1 Tax=Aureimonas flava TaxID=2320271 RepID=A0A3A1WLM7_9HYPH|nr:glutathione S-transferase family protein [Aureimonas flava]